MKRKSLLFACLLLLALPFYAAQVDTVMVQSPSMNKEVQVVVVTPNVALGKKAVACPVVYLLHGFGGNAKTWIGVLTNMGCAFMARHFRKGLPMKKGLFSFAPMARTLGFGIVRRIKTFVMKHLFPRNWSII